MRWPFGPPHLTLKPSKKKQKKQKKQRKKNKNKKKQKKETAKIPKNSFSVISQIFPFLAGFSKFTFFDTLAQKARTQKTL